MLLTFGLVKTEERCTVHVVWSEATRDYTIAGWKRLSVEMVIASPPFCTPLLRPRTCMRANVKAKRTAAKSLSQSLLMSETYGVAIE